MNMISNINKISSDNISLLQQYIDNAPVFTSETKDNLKLWLNDSFKQVSENGEDAHEMILRLLKSKCFEELQDRFFEKISVGTAGIRGKLGIGAARINEATVGMFAQAHARYLARLSVPGRAGIIIGGDSRKGSYDPYTKGPGYLQKMVAEIYAGAGIKVFLADKPLPTPIVSFAIGEVVFDGNLPLSGAINTASHNPASDNGFKIYEHGGHQVVTPEFKKELEKELKEINTFGKVVRANLKALWPQTEEELFSEIKQSGRYIIETDKAPIIIFDSEAIIREYVDKIVQLRNLTSFHVLKNPSHPYYFDPMIVKSLSHQKIVITTLNGNGWTTIRVLLENHGLKEGEHFFSVPEETVPDGNFPVGHGNFKGNPNPEYPENFYNAIKIAHEIGAKYVFACDPDSDRIGIGMLPDEEVQNHEECFRKTRFFSGNEQLCIVAWYLGIFRQYSELDVFIQTRVSSDLYSKIVRYIGGTVHKVLVGFKYFGQIANHYVSELINKIEKDNPGFDRKAFSKKSYNERMELYANYHIPCFIHGGEESMGQNMGDFVYDKDTPATIALFTEIIGFLGLPDKKKKEIVLECNASLSSKPSFAASQSRFLKMGEQSRNFEHVLNALFEEFGCYKEDLFTLKFEGEKGDKIQKKVMQFFRESTLPELNSTVFSIIHAVAKADYLICKDKNGDIIPRGIETPTGKKFLSANESFKFQISENLTLKISPFSFSWINGELPKELDSSDYIAFYLEDGCEIHIRPSGTEPMIKVYINAFKPASTSSKNALLSLKKEMDSICNQIKLELNKIEKKF